MRLEKIVWLALLLVLMVGCQGGPFSDDADVETWEFLPFYGEIQFLIVSDETDTPIPDAVLEVANLRIDELKNRESVRSGQDGRIVIHQTMRGITYMGAGPPPATFIFSAQGYQTQTYSVKDLVLGTSYDPYSSNNLPTAMYKGEVELPVYEFTIRLTPGD
jgi:hypothetical protein